MLAAGALIGLGAGAAASALLAGSATASTAAVVAGAGALINQAGNAISQTATKISNAVNSAKSDPVKSALKKLNSSGLRPGQTQISRSKVMEIANNFDSIKAQSSIYSNGGTRYLVEGHHTTVASTILGRGTGPNMGLFSPGAPEIMNVYWSKHWYEFGKTVIKIME